MKYSIFATAATLLYASLAAATPLLDSPHAPITLEPRGGGGKNDGCPDRYFIYRKKGCCLKDGGPSGNPPPPPNNTGCPRNYYWNGSVNCCTPRSRPPTDDDNPSCDNSTFPRWNRDRGCCEKPPSNPPQPQPSPKPGKKNDDNHGRNDRDHDHGRGDNGRGYHKRTSNTHVKKAAQVQKATPAFTCPTGHISCPIPGTTGEVECFETVFESHACGGCPTLGGMDCHAIDFSATVTCEAGVLSEQPSCVVHSCAEGYKPSSDRRSCVLA